MTLAYDIRTGKLVGQVCGYDRETLDTPDTPQWIQALEGTPTIRLLTGRGYESVLPHTVRLVSVP